MLEEEVSGWGVIGDGMVSGPLHTATDLLSNSIPVVGYGKHK